MTQKPDNPQARYFTVEFLCDSMEQARQLCGELQDKYPIACRAESGVRISSWLDGAIPQEVTHD